MAIPWTIPENWQEASLRLATWQAEPMSSTQAGQYRQGVRELLQHAYQKGGETSLLKIIKMTARYWLGDFRTEDFENLLCTLDGEKYQALACLVYGQLLASQKRSGAHDMLKQGFDRIQPWLQADEYFTLLKRHEVLGILTLSPSGSMALSLQELLNEAAIVRKLQGVSRTVPTHRGRSDTLG